MAGGNPILSCPERPLVMKFFMKPLVVMGSLPGLFLLKTAKLRLMLNIKTYKMKRLLLVAMFLWSVAYGQVCADEDTVRSNAASLITATTARINGTVAHFTGTPTSLQLRYVRVGQTDTATASSAPTTALRNLTGLQPNTQYVYYYKTICGSKHSVTNHRGLHIYYFGFNYCLRYRTINAVQAVCFDRFCSAIWRYRYYP